MRRASGPGRWPSRSPRRFRNVEAVPRKLTVLFTPLPRSLLPVLWTPMVAQGFAVGRCKWMCTHVFGRSQAMDTRTLLTTDLAALIHPLHHPADHQAPVVFVSGQGAVLRDADGHEYLDGLSSLWNVNAGHGRTELAGAAALEEAIMREGPDTVAAFIAEPVIGAGGVIPPTPDYFPAVREICDRHHVLFIADEIITGFGRTGRWFALDHWGVQPDLVTFAKGVTSAYLPLGGVMVSRRVHEAIVQAPMSERFMHAATYSGHPTCCAVGLANLDILEREQLVERGAAMGARLQQKAQSLRQLPMVGDVRGVGLMCGIELVADKATKAPALQVGGKILGEARRRGLITRIRTGQAGAHPIGDTICLAPPLVVSEAQIDRMIEILRESITAVA